jgi:hypothetical protein
MCLCASVVETGFMGSALFEIDLLTAREPGIPGGGTPPSTAGETPAATDLPLVPHAPSAIPQPPVQRHVLRVNFIRSIGIAPLSRGDSVGSHAETRRRQEGPSEKEA